MIHSKKWITFEDFFVCSKDPFFLDKNTSVKRKGLYVLNNQSYEIQCTFNLNRLWSNSFSLK